MTTLESTPRVRRAMPWRAILILLGVSGYLAWRAVTALTPTPLDPVLRPLIGTW